MSLYHRERVIKLRKCCGMYVYITLCESNAELEKAKKAARRIIWVVTPTECLAGQWGYGTGKTRELLLGGSTCSPPSLSRIPTVGQVTQFAVPVLAASWLPCEPVCVQSPLRTAWRRRNMNDCMQWESVRTNDLSYDGITRCTYCTAHLIEARK